MGEELFRKETGDLFRRAAMNRKQAAEIKHPSLNGKRVLFAEDEVTAAHMMFRILSAQGIRAKRAENGHSAVEMFRASEENYYSAVILDIHMPIMDGLEAAKTIREMGRADSFCIPIIALTASEAEDDQRLSKEAGMTSHLTKPIEPEMLYRTLEQLMPRN